MATLAPLSNINTERGRIALAILLMESPHFRYLDQNSGFELDATDFQLKPEDSDESVQGRALGAGYNASDMVPGTPIGDALAFLGTYIDVDVSHEADRERGLRDVDVYLDKRFRRRFKSWARGVETKYFQGDPGVTATDPKGLRTILDGTVLPGFTSFTGVANAADALDAAPDSFDLSAEANWDPFIEAMDLWLSKVDNPTGIEVAPLMHARMTTIARRKHILGESRDQFGRPVPTFNGVPLIRVNEGTITLTEPDDADVPVNETTSVYISSVGEMQVSVVTNSGLDFRDHGELDGEQSNRIKWEIRGQNKIEEENRILRVRNFKLG